LISAAELGISRPVLPAPQGFYTPRLTAAPVVPRRERVLRGTLFVAVFASSVAFIEPSPHDALMGALAFVALIAGLRFPRLLALPLLLLVLFNASGLIALINAYGNDKSVQYAATSIYLAVATLIFACLFSEPDTRRLDIMRTAYVLTAVLAALEGMAGYFHLFHGSDSFLVEARATGMFKDPNVFGPFLIWPALALLERLLMHRLRLLDIGALGIILIGLMLSFSRGAWFHFAVSGGLLIVLCLLTAPSTTVRFRIVGLSAISLVALAGVAVVLLSIPSVASMFAERAHLINSYDIGQGGRFRLQELAVTAVLNNPDGMGPLEFARVNGLQQHNVYLQAFLVYGWIGGAAYLLLLGATLFVAFRNMFLRTPWQPYLLTATTALVGEIAEGMIIDTDHWRHFFLLLGIVWGCAAATVQYRRQMLGCSPVPPRSIPTYPR
jgi:O-antigen ligase